MKLIKLLEDVMNNVTFDLKFSEQGEELMDFIKSDVSFSEELDQINTILQKMKEDGVYSKSKAYDMYSDLVSTAARTYVRDMHGDFREEEYFLDKDIITLTYYFLKKFEIPMSGGKNDNVDTPPEQPAAEQPPTGGEEPAAELPPIGGEAPTGGGEPPAELPPIGGEAPAAEVPPGEDTGMPKPEDVEDKEEEEPIKEYNKFKRKKKSWKERY